MKLLRFSCCAYVCLLLLASALFSQQVAITIDDLPSHGILPPGVTRTDVAKSILKALKEAHTPKVYGFVNAKNSNSTPRTSKCSSSGEAPASPSAITPTPT
jgi:peptidoglycan-N-acetylglucosamine deacetylase